MEKQANEISNYAHALSVKYYRGNIERLLKSAKAKPIASWIWKTMNSAIILLPSGATAHRLISIINSIMPPANAIISQRCDFMKAGIALI